MGSSNTKIKQVESQAVLLINEMVDSSQTMVKLCKNGKEWLSPTGWSGVEKSTLLDSEAEDGSTKFSIPEAFAASLKAGDEISLKITSLSFEETIVWASANMSSPRAASALHSTADDNKTSKRGLFGRFGGSRKVEVPQQSEVERLASEARSAAEASSAEMHRAHEAKQAAEERALEAARLAEAAHKMEQERTAEAGRARAALEKAEAAQLAEEKRIEAERLAEEARIAEEARLAELARIAEEKRIEAERRAEEARLAEKARLAELARRKENALKLDEKRLADISRINAELVNSKGAIGTLEVAAQDLEGRAKKAKAFVKSQGEIEAQAQRTFETAERKTAEGEAELSKRLQAEQSAKDDVKRMEKTLAEQQKLTHKSANEAQKAQAAQIDAAAAAKAAAEKANELRVAATAAQDAAQALQRNYEANQLQVKELGEANTTAEAAGVAARTSLEHIKDTLGQAKAGLKDASSINAEAGNALRQIGGSIEENQTELETVRYEAKKMRAKVKHLKAQKITPDNVEDMVGILKMDLEVSGAPLKKAAALASSLGGAALVMDSAEPSEGVMSKLKGLFGRGHDEEMSEEANASLADAKPTDVKSMKESIEEAKVEISETLAEKKIEEISDAADKAIAETTAKDLEPQVGLQLESPAKEEPPVKLVSETDEANLEKIIDDSEIDEDAAGRRSKMVMGLSAALLVSVAGISIVGSGFKTTKTTKTGNTEKTRINPQAVLPATITTAPESAGAAVIDPTAIDPEIIGEVPENTAIASTLPATQALETLKPEISTAETQIVDTEAPALSEKPIVQVATYTPVSTRKWGDGKPLLVKAAVSNKVKAPIRRKRTKFVQKASLATRVTANAVPAKVTFTLPAKGSLIAKPTTVKYTEVTRDVQTKLQTLGFYQGEVTGLLDVNTVAAMNNFQEIFGVEKSTKITPALLVELNNAKIVETKPEPIPEPVPTLEIIEPQLEASITPAEVKIVTPEVEPELAPDLIVDAKKTKSESAKYPSVAIRRGHDKNTTVVVAYDVDATGKVINPTIKNIKGAGRYKGSFEKAAIKAAEQSIFSAKTVNGEAVLSTGHETQFTFNVE